MMNRKKDSSAAMAWVLSGLALIVGFAVLVWSSSHQGGAKKEAKIAVKPRVSVPRPPPKKEELVNFAATTLAFAFKNNALQAKRGLVGAEIIVTGEVRDVDFDLSGKPYVSLEGGDFKTVKMVFSKTYESVLAKLRPGSTIKASGIVAGESFKIVVTVDNCKLLSIDGRNVTTTATPARP